MSDTPLVSIIMPCYNSASFIEETILSVLQQTYKNWELIICDDGSVDSSIDIVTKYLSDNIKLVKNVSSKGAAGARNTALLNAKGDFIAFLDSDDIWSKDKLINQINYMIKHGLKFTYTDYYIFEDNISNIKGKFSAPEKVSFTDIVKSCDIGCLTVVISKDIINCNFFPITPKEDYAAWIQLLKKQACAHRTPYIDSFYRLSSNSISSNKFIELKRQYNVITRYGGVGRFLSLYLVTHYAVKGLYKHFFLYKRNL